MFQFGSSDEEEPSHKSPVKHSSQAKLTSTVKRRLPVKSRASMKQACASPVPVKHQCMEILKAMSVDDLLSKVPSLLQIINDIRNGKVN